MATTKQKARPAAAPKASVVNKAGPPPLDHETIRLSAIAALARCLGGDSWFEGRPLKVPAPAERPRNHEGKRVPNEVAFARALLSKANSRQWHGPCLSYGFHPDAVLLTLVKLAMGARLELPVDVMKAGG